MTSVNPVVSIVIPAYNSEEYLGSTLEQLSNQTFKSIEVIVVNDGSRDATEVIASTFANSDNRFRVITIENSGPSVARNVGAEAAQGEYLFFIDSDDCIDDNTIETMVEVAREDDVDIVLVGYDMIEEGKNKLPAAWIQKAFAKSKRKFLLEEFPEILVKSTVWGCLYNLDYYRKANLAFEAGVIYEDQPFMAEAFAKAKKGISIIPLYKYHWVQRDGSITHIYDLQDLKARIQSAKNTFEVLKKYSVRNVYEERIRQNLNHDLLTILKRCYKVENGLDEDLLLQLKTIYLDLDDKSTLDDCVFVAWKLLAKGKLDELREYFKETNATNLKLRIVNKEGRPTVDWSTFSYIGEIQSNGVVLSDNFHPHAELAAASVVDGKLMLTIQAFITKLCPTEFKYNVTLEAVRFDEKTGKVLGKPTKLNPVSQHPWPNTIREHKAWWVNYSLNFFDFELPRLWASWNECYRFFVNISAGDYEFRIDLDSIRENVWRTIPLNTTELIKIKTFNRRRKFYYFKYIPLATISPETNSRGVFSLKVASGAFLKSANVKKDGSYPSNAKLGLKKERKNQYCLTADTSSLSNGMFFFNKLMGKNTLNGNFLLSGNFKNKNGNRIEARIKNGTTAVIRDANLVVHSNIDSGDFLLCSSGLLIKELDFINGILSISAYLVNQDIAEKTFFVELASKTTSAKYKRTIVPGKDTKMELSLSSTPPFGFPFDPGTYKLRFFSSDGTEIDAMYDERLIRRMPLDVYDACGINLCRFKYEKKTNCAAVQLFRYMPDEAKGGYGFGNLKTQYKKSEVAIDPKKVLMRTYYGENITDNALALTNEIIESGRKDLEIYWVTESMYTSIPEGTHRVIVNSPEWFQLLATAGTIIENVHQVDYFVKRPGQRVVQCFHGYPFKGMGRPYYQDHNYTQDRIESFAKREAEWDYILSPAPYATPLYKDAFNFNGTFLEIGHPRNDVLVRADFEDYRNSVSEKFRSALGIAKDKKIVLFAPTYRDYAAINEFKTQRIDFIDPSELSAALGDEYVILLRGHAMNKRAGSLVEKTENVIDVTRYPEINDLTIASDMAILDYSSLRFDYAQTGKPMIFFVPDYDKYFENRPPLVSYEETAPGALCKTKDELVSAILDAENYQEKFGKKLKEFKEKYTPLEDGYASKRFMEALFGEY